MIQTVIGKLMIMTQTPLQDMKQDYSDKVMYNQTNMSENIANNPSFVSCTRNASKRI